MSGSTPSPPVILTTQGDPAGVGPEILVKAFRSWTPPSPFRIAVAGFPAHFRAAGGPPESDWRRPANRAEAIQALSSASSGPVWIVPPGTRSGAPVDMGAVSIPAAAAALECLEFAADLAVSGEITAIVTAPIHKESMAAAGFPFPGHTEFLQTRAGVPRVAMMLTGGGLRVVLATIHEPLARVPTLLNRADLLETLRLTHRSMRGFGFAAPRIGVAGLNPHAGEGGAFGREEIEIIAPAAAAARAEGIDASPPLSADTLFHRALSGEFDAVLAMYHDQGLIPVKTLDFHGGVNTTIGLPFVRTSPDHGVAFDIAGKGMADARSMIAALGAAAEFASRRAEGNDGRGQPRNVGVAR